jgi:hypothetical protein
MVDSTHNLELIARTVEVWQPRAERHLSDEDARQIVQNLAAFFDLLHAWDVSDIGVREHQDGAEHHLP